MKKAGLVSLILFLAAGAILAQRGRGRRDWGEGSHIVETEGRDLVDEDTVRTAREIASHSTGTPNWTNDPAFSRDVFTFVRVLYARAPQGPDISWSASHWGWITDFPDSEPERDFVDLDMTNQIFHCVFDIKVPMNQLQTPNSRQGVDSLNPNSGRYGITWEYYHDDYTREGAKDMHVRAIYDDKGRIMVIATHNCDNGDGWEREGEDDGFFHEFSEKRAYPLGINVIFYLMTH